MTAEHSRPKQQNDPDQPAGAAGKTFRPRQTNQAAPVGCIDSFGTD
jgi:hypothetical protein